MKSYRGVSLRRPWEYGLGECMNNLAIGQRIRRLRHERNVTQWQLACKVGITTGALWMLERGERECTPEQMQAIANALGVSERALRGKA